MSTLNLSSILNKISPPGISTVISSSQAPILRATAPAAELLLPDARVYPAPRSQISIFIRLRLGVPHRGTQKKQEAIQSPRPSAKADLPTGPVSCGNCSEAALARSKIDQQFCKFASTKIRPKRVDKLIFRIGGLPQKEIGNARFAAGADHQIGIRQ